MGDVSNAVDAIVKPFKEELTAITRALEMAQSQNENLRNQLNMAEERRRQAEESLEAVSRRATAEVEAAQLDREGMSKLVRSQVASAEERRRQAEEALEVRKQKAEADVAAAQRDREAMAQQLTAMEIAKEEISREFRQALKDRDDLIDNLKLNRDDLKAHLQELRELAKQTQLQVAEEIQRLKAAAEYAERRATDYAQKLSTYEMEMQTREGEVNRFGAEFLLQIGDLKTERDDLQARLKSAEERARSLGAGQQEILEANRAIAEGFERRIASLTTKLEAAEREIDLQKTSAQQREQDAATAEEHRRQALARLEEERKRAAEAEAALIPLRDNFDALTKRLQEVESERRTFKGLYTVPVSVEGRDSDGRPSLVRMHYGEMDENSKPKGMMFEALVPPIQNLIYTEPPKPEPKKGGKR